MKKMRQRAVPQMVILLLFANVLSFLPLVYAQTEGCTNSLFYCRKLDTLTDVSYREFCRINNATSINCPGASDDIIYDAQLPNGIKEKIKVSSLYIPIIILTAYVGRLSSNPDSKNVDPFLGSLRPFPCNSEQRASALMPGVLSFGPLKPSPSNPRYFTDGSGKALYLTGSHTWSNLTDSGTTDPPVPFDYNGYLDFLKQYNHNFMRLWTWELTKYKYKSDELFQYVTPFPWPRTGPGTALDGKPKFDLSKFDHEYFDRLRSRAITARDNGIYVSIMLFEGHGIQFSIAPWHWDGHPFNVNNNINGIDGDPNRDGKGLESHTLQIPSIVKSQENYVKKVIDTVNDLDNVLYEISNEDHAGSIDWQYHMIDFIRNYEKTKPKQHPVGMTTYKAIGNDVVFDSDAEWISPAVSKDNSKNDPYKVNPPVADGSKVILLDTDHLWGMGGDKVWVWKSFLRGYNPIYMDDLDSETTKEGARRAMGDTLAYANKINLKDMYPRNDLSSTTFCLADTGQEYLVYQPKANASFTVNITAGRYSYEWFDPGLGTVVSTGSFTADGSSQYFTPPFSGEAVLYISVDTVHK